MFARCFCSCVEGCCVNTEHFLGLSPRLITVESLHKTPMQQTGFSLFPRWADGAKHRSPLCLVYYEALWLARNCPVSREVIWVVIRLHYFGHTALVGCFLSSTDMSWLLPQEECQNCHVHCLHTCSSHYCLGSQFDLQGTACCKSESPGARLLT